MRASSRFSQDANDIAALTLGMLPVVVVVVVVNLIGFARLAGKRKPTKVSEAQSLRAAIIMFLLRLERTGSTWPAGSGKFGVRARARDEN